MVLARYCVAAAAAGWGQNRRYESTAAGWRLGVGPERPLPYWGWGVIPDPYGRLFDADDGETPIPAPPHQPWPWGNAPEPTIITAHCPGQYTHTFSRDIDSDDED